MRRFEGKVCVVTASTAGIGLAIASRFASEGAKVVVSSRKQDGVDQAVATIQRLPNVKPGDVVGIVCQVNDKKQRERLLNTAKSTFGTIDVLVLNAAASTHFGATMKISEKQYDKMFETNVKSTFQLAQEALPYLTPSSLKKAGAFSTNIILVASIAGFNPSQPIGIYGVTKTAMFGLTRAMANDLAHKGIRVNCIAPGLIRTSFAQPLVEAFEGGSAAAPELTNQSLMKRVGESEEIGAAAAYLGSADASFVTGEILVVAGGPCRL